MEIVHIFAFMLFKVFSWRFVVCGKGLNGSDGNNGQEQLIIFYVPPHPFDFLLSQVAKHFLKLISHHYFSKS